MASLKYSGNATFQTGTLSAGYTSGGSSLSLTSGHGSRFPSSGDFWVRIDDEIFKVTSVSGDTLTVSGAQDGTSAANHSNGSTVRWVLSAAALDQLRADMALTGTYASLPSASLYKQGSVYYPTDTFYTHLVNNGSSWDHFYRGLKLTPPDNASFSDVGSPSVSTSYGGIKLSGAGTPFNVTGRKITAPATPYTVKAAFRVQSRSTTNSSVGLFFRESSSGKLSIYLGVLARDANQTVVFRMTSPTVYAGVTDLNDTATLWDQTIIFLMIEDNGTNRVYSRSFDGISWITLLTQSRTTHLTADEVGFYVDGDNVVGHLLHWVVA
jgi:hypothetical protein